MESKKKLSSSAEGEEVVGKQAKHSTDGEVICERAKKKLKNDKKEKESATEMENDADDPSILNISMAAPAQPMERKKLRKARDKNKHVAEAEGDQPKQMDVDLKENCDIHKVELSSASVTSISSVLPEFHIGVFKDLASAKASIRKVAAGVMVKELLEVQKTYDKLENKEVVEGSVKLEAEKDDGLDNCAPSVRYAVRRLIRGVSSSRECARQGFALGLTLLVGAIPKIKVDSLLKLIVNLLKITSSMNGQETRDCLLGRLSAYSSLARSGSLTEALDLKENTTGIKEFTSSLISLASKKRYLQEPAVSVLLELIEKLPVDIILAEFLEAPGVQDWFDSATEIGNPDALLLALKVREKIGIDHKAFSKVLPDYTPNKLFAGDCLSSLANCLKESTSCQPRVHSVWVNLINVLLPDMVSEDMDSVSSIQGTEKDKKNCKGSFFEEDLKRNIQSFCDTIIEGSLLTSSPCHKHLAFDILLLLFPKLPASCVEIVLSYELVQCLKYILFTKDCWLYRMARYFLEELSKWVKNDDVRRVAVIIALQKHSSGKFDCITRTKMVKNLMSEFKTEYGCTLFIQNLISMFVDEDQASEEPSDDYSEIGSIEDKDAVGPAGFTEFRKSWVVKSLHSFLKHSKLDPKSRFEVQKEILKFLAVQGLFFSSLGTEVTSFELEEKIRWPKSAISISLRRMCIEQLEILLSKSQKGDFNHALSGALETNDLGSYFIWFIGTLCNIPSVSLFRVLSDDDDKAFKKLQAIEAQLSREERKWGTSNDADKLHALRYLLIQLLLQILLRPGEFSEGAVELIICCKRAFGNSDLLDSSGEDESSVDGTPHNMDVLVDTMLSLLPQSSAPLHSAMMQVFRYFSNDITENGLIRMLHVINKDLKPAGHHEAVTDDEDEAETSKTADSDEQTDDSEAVGGMETISTELPEGSDDDAVFLADISLARIFKKRKNQAGRETAQWQLVLFKLRVLKLLDIYLDENPGKPQVLRILLSLIEAYVKPHTTEGSVHLANRILAVVYVKILKAKDYPRDKTLQVSIVETLLEKNLKKAAKAYKENALAVDVTFWTLKVIDANFSLSDKEKVLEILKGVFVSYFDSKKAVSPDFLWEILRRQPWVGHILLGFVLEKCANAKLQFRQEEALSLIEEMVGSSIFSGRDDEGFDSKKMLKEHLPLLAQLIKKLVLNIPQKRKQRRVEYVQSFCYVVFPVLRNHDLSSSFLMEFEPEERACCAAELGYPFRNLERTIGK